MDCEERLHQQRVALLTPRSAVVVALAGRSPPLLEAVTERVSGAQELVIMHMRMHAHAESGARHRAKTSVMHTCTEPAELCVFHS